MTAEQNVKRKAYSYVRFSTPDQMNGGSFERQTKKAADYASAHDLDLDTTLTFQDLGVSQQERTNGRAQSVLGRC
jgi:DNA invertase Pin-like site-specific DNA recombinase